METSGVFSYFIQYQYISPVKSDVLLAQLLNIWFIKDE